MTIHAEDDEFKMKVADTIMKLRLTSDTSHEHAAGSEHLQDAINHFTDAIQLFLNALSQFMFYHNDKSVILNPMCQHHFVKVWYHGMKPLTIFTVTVNKGMYVQCYSIDYLAI